ncbi:MAG TPA: hypothetical protein VM536_14110 [Chloroflexia bacterium]|nr:hypothetical protein [Chloroflexia bacterium]
MLWLDVAAGEICNLTQPGWDPFFVLAPGGHGLRLSICRAGFRTSTITPVLVA